MTSVLRRRRLLSIHRARDSMLATVSRARSCSLRSWARCSSAGLKGWSWTTFSQSTPAPQSEGGLLNAIFGSFVMTVIGRFGAPIGVLAGTYLSEYGRRSNAQLRVVRFVNDILLSAPSIVLGLFVYELVVDRQVISPAGQARSRWHHRDAGRRAHDRRHAAARSERACARPPSRSARRTWKVTMLVSTARRCRA